MWCGFGATRESATGLVGSAMETFYGVPFAKFDRYIPRGTPQDVAEFVLPYIRAGCSDVHLLPVAVNDAEAVESCGEVRKLLLAELGTSGPAALERNGRG